MSNTKLKPLATQTQTQHNPTNDRNLHTKQNQTNATNQVDGVNTDVEPVNLDSHVDSGERRP